MEVTLVAQVYKVSGEAGSLEMSPAVNLLKVLVAILHSN